VNPFSESAFRDEGLRTDWMSAVKGAVAPVVTKHSFDSEDQFHDLAIFVPDLEDPGKI
jgi:hypothetical protein